MDGRTDWYLYDMYEIVCNHNYIKIMHTKFLTSKLTLLDLKTSMANAIKGDWKKLKTFDFTWEARVLHVCTENPPVHRGYMDYIPQGRLFWRTKDC